MQHPSEEKLVQGLVHNMQAACQALLNEPQVKDIGEWLHVQFNESHGDCAATRTQH